MLTLENGTHMLCDTIKNAYMLVHADRIQYLLGLLLNVDRRLDDFGTNVHEVASNFCIAQDNISCEHAFKAPMIFFIFYRILNVNYIYTIHYF